MPRRSNCTASFSAMLQAWMAPPSIWWAAPSGLMISPASTAIQSRRTRIFFRRLDIGDNGAIGAQALVLRKNRGPGRNLHQPNCHAVPPCRRRLRSRPCRVVVEMVQAIGDRIAIVGRGELR